MGSLLRLQLPVDQGHHFTVHRRHFLIYSEVTTRPKNIVKIRVEMMLTLSERKKKKKEKSLRLME